MKKFLRELFCRHKITTWYYTQGDDNYYESQRYYDDFLVKICNDCGKVIENADL
jgi:NAD dependent epimerase/dehydratase family enzyme